ncbi:TPA: hypothetical protein LUK63_004244 [Escherichia coli]|nr:hypothetical protein [Escherichia coli]HBM2247362.1 hypothetical protein [Escherichia coli]
MASTPNSLNPTGPAPKMMPEGSRKAVYQLSGKGIVEHSRSAFADLEAKGDQIVAGRTYTVGYVNGKGTARPGQAASLAQQQQRSASKGGGISL